MSKSGKWIAAVAVLVSGIAFAVVVVNLCLAPRNLFTATMDKAALVPAENQIRAVYAYGGMDALTKYCSRTVIVALWSYMTCETYPSEEVGDGVALTTYLTEDEAVAQLQIQEYLNERAGGEELEVSSRFARDPTYAAIEDRTYKSRGDPIQVHWVALPHRTP